MINIYEQNRYERQIRIFGEEGQDKLKKAEVLIAGVGGLGCSVSTYLAVAGVGKLKLVDYGKIELSNLNRQILFTKDDIGRKKVNTAEEKLKKINPNTEIQAISRTIKKDNITELVKEFDVIVDALDNFSTRYLLNKAAIENNIPLIHGAVHGFYGQATTIIPGKTACLKCIFPEAPPRASLPMVGTFCGIIGCIQATETIKFILGIGDLLENKLLMLDGLSTLVEEIHLERNPNC